MILLRVKNVGGAKCRQVEFMQYKEGAVPSNAVEKSLSCICVKWSFYCKWTTMSAIRSLNIVF